MVPARDRILDTAAELFYANGYRAVGVDTVIARSCVALENKRGILDRLEALASAASSGPLAMPWRSAQPPAWSSPLRSTSAD